MHFLKRTITCILGRPLLRFWARVLRLMPRPLRSCLHATTRCDLFSCLVWLQILPTLFDIKSCLDFFLLFFLYGIARVRGEKSKKESRGKIWNQTRKEKNFSCYDRPHFWRAFPPVVKCRVVSGRRGRGQEEEQENTKQDVTNNHVLATTCYHIISSTTKKFAIALKFAPVRFDGRATSQYYTNRVVW